MVDRLPELAATPLATHVQSGHLGPSDIRNVQMLLASKGFACGPTGVDGLYGPFTNLALMELLAGASPRQGSPPNISRPVADLSPSMSDTQTGLGDRPPTPPAVWQITPERSQITPEGPKIAPEGPALLSGPGVLPPRPANATGGRAFLEQTSHLSRSQREEAICQQVMAGNVPDFQRQMRDVTASIRTPDGRTVTATYQVLPDYLAIGSDQDFVRIPMDPLTAQRLATRMGCTLPTKLMVDQVYSQASVKLPPSPLPAGPEMMSNGYYQRANDAIERQRMGLDAPLGALTAGDKKDVIISNAISAHPGRVIIYGWHQPNGKAIQPTSWIHEESYADYSHGIRLVSGTMVVNGQKMAVSDVLADPVLCRLLSDEGPIRHPVYPVN
jgi:hypothetical protein